MSRSDRDLTPPTGCAERRRHPRHEVQAAVLVTPLDQPHLRFWARAVSVSQGGMFLRTAEELPLYAELEARIVPDTIQPFRARARVVRTQAGEGLGCCFSHLSAQSQLYLELWLGRSGGLPQVAGVIERQQGN